MADYEVVGPSSHPNALRRAFRTFMQSPKLIGGGYVLLIALVAVLVLALIIVGATSGSDDDDSDGESKERKMGECVTKFAPITTAFRTSLHQSTRAKLFATLVPLITTQHNTSFVYLEGGSVDSRYDTDVELAFRQESHFLYATGVDMADVFALLTVDTQKCLLFVPEADIFYQLWNGIILTKDQIKAKYGVDNVYYHGEFPTVMQGLTAGVADLKNVTVYTLNTTVEFKNMEQYTINKSVLESASKTARQVKTDKEVTVMRISSQVSADAHAQVMRMIVNDVKDQTLYEYSVASTFVDLCAACGLQHQAYSSIVGAGYHSAILHYTENSALLNWKSSSTPQNHHNILLIDAGAEFMGYGSDITRTYPIDGKFNDQQTILYTMVYNVQAHVLKLMIPGADWLNLEQDVRTTTCHELQKNDFIVANLDCKDTGIANTVVRTFLPHSFGHLLGLDVHDGFSFPNIPLTKNMVVTCEPGIYFNRVGFELVFNNATHPARPYMNQDLINDYLNKYEVGGVRIEDVVLITETGHELLSSGVPTKISDIEELLSQ